MMSYKTNHKQVNKKGALEKSALFFLLSLFINEVI